jgi:formyltetrahydrofolate-dependent phosphoribosylglycinamide formyltransferase
MSSVSERLLCLQQIKRIQASTNSTEDILKAIEGRNKRTVLIVGGGGREHAIALKLSESPDVDRIICAPGNAGTSGSGKISNEKVDDIPAYAQSNNVHLVVVGPEVPLVAGLADDLAKLHIPCFGPSAAAAQIEASKAWAKEFMNRHNIPTSQHRTFKRDELSSAEEYVKTCGFRLVVKASGLAAGKGVLIPESQEETLKALSDVFLGNAFGAAGDEVVLEERMEGPEASMLAFCDGKTVQMMPAAQDHKRALDNDNGLNTGGMGAYAPAPIITEAIANQIKVEVLEPALAGLAQEGRPFVGVLYAGMMLTTLGPKVIEFNCRFGDPETQVILPLLKSDLLHIMEACVTGTLDTIKVDWSKQHAVTIVAASEGYPLSYPKGRSIKGMNIVSKLTNANGDSATVYHAGTRVSATDANTIETSGGRVLAVTALSTASLQSAVSTAYAGMRAINFEGMQYRYDIARRALSNNTTTGETKENMPTLRIGVLGSTRGTDLASLIKAIDNGRLNGGKIVCVVSNKSKAIILEKARVASIPAIALKYTKNMSRDDYDAQVTKTLKEYSVDVVLMIGYMRIVSPSFTAEWAGKLLNVHPSLLPEFAGGMDMDVHAEVLKAKKTITGCTVHLVTDVVDGGEIVARRHCSVGENDTADTLKARVQAMEGEALLSSLRAVQDGTVMAIHNAENSVGSSSTVRFLLYFSFYFVIVDCYPTSPPLLNNCTK